MSNDDKEIKLEDVGQQVIDESVGGIKGEAQELLDKKKKSFLQKIAFWKKDKADKEQPVADESKAKEGGASEEQSTTAETKTSEKKKKTFWQKIAFWKKDKADKKQPIETKEQPVDTKEQPVDTKGQPADTKEQSVVAESKDEQSAVSEEETVSIEVNAPVSKTKKFWQKMTSWTRKKTPEERQKAAESKLEKAQKKYEEALAKAREAKTKEERDAVEAKALNAYNKSCAKIEKKYPDEVKKIKEDKAKREAEEIAARDARIKAAAEQELKASEEAAQRFAARKAAEEKAEADRIAAEAAAKEASEAQNQFDSRVQSKDAIRKARGKLSREERKTAAIKGWMDTVHLPEEKAQQLIDKYGLDMAYQLGLRCMREPDTLMHEVDSEFKKIQNKSGKSIQYFIDLDITNADNKATVERVTNMTLVQKEDGSAKDTKESAPAITLGATATQDR